MGSGAGSGTSWRSSGDRRVSAYMRTGFMRGSYPSWAVPLRGGWEGLRPTDPPTVTSSRLLRTGVVLVAVAAALAGPAPAPAADALDRARATGRLSHAEYALERARSLFSPAEV